MNRRDATIAFEARQMRKGNADGTVRKTRFYAPCSYCRRPIPPGKGYVYRCRGGRSCPAPEACIGGFHAQCWDRTECKREALKNHKAALASARASIPEQLEAFCHRKYGRSLADIDQVEAISLAFNLHHELGVR